MRRGGWGCTAKRTWQRDGNAQCPMSRVSLIQRLEVMYRSTLMLLSGAMIRCLEEPNIMAERAHMCVMLHTGVRTSSTGSPWTSTAYRGRVTVDEGRELGLLSEHFWAAGEHAQHPTNQEAKPAQMQIGDLNVNLKFHMRPSECCYNVAPNDTRKRYSRDVAEARVRGQAMQ